MTVWPLSPIKFMAADGQDEAMPPSYQAGESISATSTLIKNGNQSTSLTKTHQTQKLLGQILVQRRVLQPCQLEMLLSEQADTYKKLGELAMELCYVSCEDVTRALFEQEMRKHGYWIIS